MKKRKHRILSAALVVLLLACGTMPLSAETAGNGETAAETEKTVNAAETREIAGMYEAIQSDCSPWAVEEVSEAIAKGLVPEHLQSDYQKPVTRGELAELTAYYELWHEPKGTTLEEMWAKKDDKYDQQREKGDSDYYRTYQENVFSDTNEELFNRMYQFRYISGYPDGTFRPDKNVKRMEAAKMLWNAMEPHMGGHMYPVSWYTQAVGKFQDIDVITNFWYEIYERSVAWMWVCGCIKGYSETIYGPEYPMTREQAIVAVLRMAKHENYF